MTGMKHTMLPMTDLQDLSRIFVRYNANIKKEKEKEKEKGKGKGKEKVDETKEPDPKVQENLPEQAVVATEGVKLHAFLVGQACHWISLISVTDC